MLWARLALAVATCCALFVSCSGREHPPAFQPAQGGSAGSGPSDAGLDIDIGGETGTPCGIQLGGAICGDQVIPAIEDPPNLYFVIDASGSMTERLEGSARDKYTNARIAVSVLLDAIGHRVRFGAAVFPAFDFNPDGCAPGRQIFETTRGDPPCAIPDGGRSEKVQNLLRQLEYVPLGGGSPVASSLDALAPTLRALPGATYVVLITDGAPNCNFAASCDPSSCIPNIEGLSAGGQACSPSFNCCDPRLLGPGAQGSCVDADESERAIAELYEAGISTFVIGMPGSEPYAAALERMAVAGGTARDVSPTYYSTTDTESLTEALFGIGTGVAIRCDLALEQVPPDQDRVNVYFDGEIVPFGDDGWTWTSDQSIEILGESCERLRSGTVFEVQILSGCATVVR